MELHFVCKCGTANKPWANKKKTKTKLQFYLKQQQQQQFVNDLNVLSIWHKFAQSCHISSSKIIYDTPLIDFY